MDAFTRTFRRLVETSPEAELALGALGRLRELGAVDAAVPLEEFWTLLEAALAAPSAAGPEPAAGRVFVGRARRRARHRLPAHHRARAGRGRVPGRAAPGPHPARRRAPPADGPSARGGGAGARARALRAGRRIRSAPRRPDVPAHRRGERAPARAVVPRAGSAGVGDGTAPRLSRPSSPSRAGGRSRFIRRRPSARERPLDEREWLVTRALAARSAPEPLLRQLPGARRGLAAIRSREGTDALTAYDGLLGRGVDLGAAPLAPTALERYASCPFRFLLERVYRLEAVEEPDRILMIDPRDRGDLVHAVLEATFRHAGGERERCRSRASASRRRGTSLDAAFAAACAEAERRGLTGLPALWAGEQARLREELRSALEAEADDPAGWRPALFEVAFGIERPASRAATAPLVYRLPDGSTLAHSRPDRPDRRLTRRAARTRPRLQDRQAPVAADAGPAGEGPRAPAARSTGWPPRRSSRPTGPASVEEAQYYHVIGPDAGTRVRFTRAGWEIAPRRLRPGARHDRRRHPRRAVLPAARRVRARPVRLRPGVRRRARAVGGGQARRSRGRGPRDPGRRSSDAAGTLRSPRRRWLDDDAERRRALEDLDTTFLVEAAAGSGKTTLLLGRIVNLVRSGRARLAEIAAVTFTEKAAADLRIRLRGELARAGLHEALRELEIARIGTIHAFAAGLLRERPVEAGVDPGFTVADPLTARLLLDRAWESWLPEALSEPGGGRDGAGGDRARARARAPARPGLRPRGRPRPARRAAGASAVRRARRRP